MKKLFKAQRRVRMRNRRNSKYHEPEGSVGNSNMVNATVNDEYEIASFNAIGPKTTRAPTFTESTSTVLFNSTSKRPTTTTAKAKTQKGGGGRFRVHQPEKMREAFQWIGSDGWADRL